MTGRSDIDWRQ